MNFFDILDDMIVGISVTVGDTDPATLNQTNRKKTTEYLIDAYSKLNYRDFLSEGFIRIFM
jgi:hypothetical protein